MTDAERFGLDAQLRRDFEAAEGDLSRARQLAGKYAEIFRGLGLALASTPEKVDPWRNKSGEWRLPFTDIARNQLGEIGLPEWDAVKAATDDIRRLTKSVDDLGAEMKKRRLA